MADIFVYIGTYTKENGSSLKRNACAEGISVYKIADDNVNAWELVQKMPILNPCVFDFGQERSYLYSLSADSNVVTGFSVDPVSGKLDKLCTRVIENTKNIAVLTVSHKGDRLIAADFYGNVFVMNLDPDGSIGDVCCEEALPGKIGPLRETWQPCSRPHHIVLSEDDRYVYIPDKGLDKIHTYELTPAPDSQLRLCSQIDVRRAGCPRHLAVSPDGKFLYCNLEFGNAVVACELVDCIPEAFQMVQTLPETYVEPISKTAEIQIHPSGKWLYVSNRGHNSIAVFSIDKDGFIKVIQWMDCGGGIPRSFEIDPSGRKLFCCNQFSNEITSFDINIRTGILSPSRETIKTPCPVWLRFSGDYPVKKKGTQTVEGIT